MKLKFLAIASVFLSLTAQAEVGTVTAGFGYANVFTSPSELNTVIDLYNTLYGLTAPAMGTAAKFSFYSDYELNSEWGLGVSYSYMSPSVYASRVSGTTVISGKVETSTSLIGIRARYSMLKNGMFSMYLIPTLGLAFYGIDSTTTLYKVSSSGTGIFGGLSVSGKLSFNKTIGLALDLGYQFAKSGTLTVDSQSGTTLTTGSDYVVLGNPMKLNSGGIFVCAGIEFSFDPAVAASNSMAK